MEKQQLIIDVEILHKDTDRGSVYFEGFFNFEPNEDDLYYAQLKAGYHPKGYGKPYSTFKVKSESGKTWGVRWICANSCD